MKEIENIELKFLSMDDYEQLKNLMIEAYKMMPNAYWKEHQIKTLIEKFPEGQVVIKINNQLAGCALSLIVDYRKFETRHTYRQITGNYTFNTHDPNGDMLYGIDIFVAPEFRGLRIGRRLYDYRKELCERINLRGIAFGGRIPNYLNKQQKSRIMKPTVVIFLFLTLIFVNGYAQDYRPGLFFREDWKETPAEIPLSQKHVSNPDLLVQLYGPGQDSLKKSNHPQPVDDPFYVWSGLCLGNWMVTLKHKSSNVDLSGFAKISWRSKQAGLRQLRITLKLANGTWLVSDQFDDTTKDWRIKEFNIQDMVWYKLDAKSVVEIGPATNPDLSNVEEIGFTDLMPGGKSASCSRLDWIEVYGKPVKR